MESPDNRPVVMSFNTEMKGPNNKKAWLIVIAVGLVIAGIIGAIIALANNTQQGESDSDVAISENIANVNIEITGIVPATVKVKKGQQITFTNNDTRLHRLTADQTILPGFDSTEDLATGDSYTYVFEMPGTYKYFDPSDPKTFNGTIVVEQ